MKIGTQKIYFFFTVFLVVVLFFWQINQAANRLKQEYEKRESIVLRDRHAEIIQIKQNSFGYYAEYKQTVSARIQQLLLSSEDRYFFYHPGVNPGSIFRAVRRFVLGQPNRASSTITQQLSKILLSHENDRSIKNKLTELWYTLALELSFSKKEILMMYINSVYMGNSVQGFQSASRLYFEKNLEELSETEIATLVATIPDPSKGHPFTNTNNTRAVKILKSFNLENDLPGAITIREIQERKKRFADEVFTKTAFELDALGVRCTKSCTLTIDKKVTETIREIVQRNILQLEKKNVQHGAVVVINPKTSELIAIVGSPDPKEERPGYKINMAVRYRPIGSTVKPFIYLEGFARGLRPYTIVDDREYRYTVGTGFSFYPKNYDYTYHGPVTLHYALTNSLNVPTVKVLEYVGIDTFGTFLTEKLEFKLLQDIRTYELGIALGGLEMDLAHLAYYFTLFPNHGTLSPLQFGYGKEVLPPKDFTTSKKISPRAYVDLVTKILSDRQTGIEQFGDKSSLTLAQKNYAVKTGTSREFHDSWTVGYTPDFVVGVWVGNSDNTPMDSVSGQLGAGTIWHETMNALFASEYNQKTPFSLEIIKEFTHNGSVEYGLPYDEYEKMEQLLSSSDLIVKPYHGDIFLLEPNMIITAQATEIVHWYLNGRFMGKGKTQDISPAKPGEYTLKAVGNEKEAFVRFSVVGNE